MDVCAIACNLFKIHPHRWCDRNVYYGEINSGPRAHSVSVPIKGSLQKCLAGISKTLQSVPSNYYRQIISTLISNLRSRDRRNIFPWMKWEVFEISKLSRSWGHTPCPLTSGAWECLLAAAQRPQECDPEPARPSFSCAFPRLRVGTEIRQWTEACFWTQAHLLQGDFPGRSCAFCAETRKLGLGWAYRRGWWRCVCLADCIRASDTSEAGCGLLFAFLKALNSGEVVWWAPRNFTDLQSKGSGESTKSTSYLWMSELSWGSLLVHLCIPDDAFP